MEGVLAALNRSRNITLADLRLLYDSLYDSEHFGSQQSNSKANQLIWALAGVATLSVCCLGLLGNALSLVVLTRRSMRSSTYVYLAALAVSDMIVCLLTAALASRDALSSRHADLLYAFAFPYIHPLCVVFQVTSVWLTLAFTIDRYIMICHPFSSSNYCTVSRARLVIVCTYIGGFIFNIPKFLEYHTKQIPLPFSNKLKFLPALTEIGATNTFRVVVHAVMYLSCVCGIPLTTIAVLNIFLIAAVRRSRRMHLSPTEVRRNNTTVMLIGVIIIFMICQLPALVSRSLWATSLRVFTSSSTSLNQLNEIANFLVTVHSAVNFIPYFFVGARFRRHFIVIFCNCLTQNTLRDLRISERRISVLEDRRTTLSSIRYNPYKRRSTSYSLPRDSYSLKVRDVSCCSLLGEKQTDVNSGLQVDRQISQKTLLSSYSSEESIKSPEPRDQPDLVKHCDIEVGSSEPTTPRAPETNSCEQTAG